MPRKTWDEYFLDMAQAVSSRATCPRIAVGAVVVRANHEVLSTGYNGAPSGYVHCEDEGCLIVKGHCIRPVHAEVNAVARSHRNTGGQFREEAVTVYSTLKPCDKCLIAIKYYYPNAILKWSSDEYYRQKGERNA